MKTFLVRRMMPICVVFTMASCGLMLGFLAAGVRMPVWEQFVWPSATAAWALACGFLQKTCDGLLRLANTQNDLLAAQARQLRSLGYLLRVPSRWISR